MTSRRLLTPTARALLDAADRIETHGHCKGAFIREDRRCAIAAIMTATKDDAVQNHAIKTLYDYIGISNIAAWNDHTSRTAEEVVCALRGAATHPTAQNAVTQDER